ncbi:hypothetical protein [Noviherbaspirillum massiliense]|uniref:hypothetical protein n=1 Tax=Noviherbaspirillum massiliense TaxID=1465823 RepID=UPI0002D8420F|nr:hypothetical protein [Noviherbaspirillum massiliense]
MQTIIIQDLHRTVINQHELTGRQTVHITEVRGSDPGFDVLHQLADVFAKPFDLNIVFRNGKW